MHAWDVSQLLEERVYNNTQDNARKAGQTYEDDDCYQDSCTARGFDCCGNQRTRGSRFDYWPCESRWHG